MPLLEQSLVSVGGRGGDIGAKTLALLSESLVQEDRTRQVLIVGVNLLRELVHKLVKTEVDLSLDLVVEELLLEDCQGVKG